MSKFTLTCQNDSPAAVQFCLFQRFREERRDAASLLWMCQSCAPRAATRFSWSDELCFVWGFAQSLRPGDNIFTAQALPIQEGKTACLRMQDDVLSLQTATQASESEGLTILTDQTVPGNTTAVGIGMQGKCMCATGALMVSAGPNSCYQFEGALDYYLSTAPSMGLELGDVLDVNAFSNTVKITFPYGIQQLNVHLSDSNQLFYTSPKYDHENAHEANKNLG